ncbi:MAG: hypothetical protein HUU01_07350 [Saprospiraceae bacterium]|nr:hypothetical protein [Saprospiraceae bacterium]
MMRNHLTPIQLFSILMIGVSLFLFVFAFFFQQEAIMIGVAPGSTTLNREALVFRNICIIAGLIVLVPALALLSRQKWAVVVFTVFFWLVGIMWTGLLAILVSNRNDLFNVEYIVFLGGFSALIYSCTIAGVLYLDNAWVVESLPENPKEKVGLSDVLDQ